MRAPVLRLLKVYLVACSGSSCCGGRVHLWPHVGSTLAPAGHGGSAGPEPALSTHAALVHHGLAPGVALPPGVAAPWVLSLVEEPLWLHGGLDKVLLGVSHLLVHLHPQPGHPLHVLGGQMGLAVLFPLK